MENYFKYKYLKYKAKYKSLKYGGSKLLDDELKKAIQSSSFPFETKMKDDSICSYTFTPLKI